MSTSDPTRVPIRLSLTLAAVKEAGLKAYNEKRLSAQGPTPACRYRDDSGRPCIIGASIPDEIAATLPSQYPVWLLRSYGVHIDSETICYLQRLHDAWATSLTDPAHAIKIVREPKIQPPEYYEAKLVAALKHP